VGVDAAEDVVVSADRLRLEQALGNLVANAAAHGDPPVRLSARLCDGSVELHVEDAGPGLPAGFIPRAFERFTRADSARTGGGAGLGLAIVDAVARAHGGRAGVAESASGADVWIALPALTDSSSGERRTVRIDRGGIR
jgi:two-component system OmpR family sensor kinase